MPTRNHQSRTLKRVAAKDPVSSAQPSATFFPATADRWDDVVKVFGPRGACAGCWCLWWRLPHREWRAQRGEGNRVALERIVKTGPPPGVVAYVGEQPAGWCAVAPRAEYVRLATSRILQPVDDQPVWSVTCFFVTREFRRQGLSVELLKAAVRFAAERGARIVEGYPSEPKGRQADSFVYTGLASAFLKAGFVEVARRSPTRPIMRWMAWESEASR